MDSRVAARYVYILRSLHDPSLTYVGLTTDVRRRLATHNSGGSRATPANRPWALIVSIEFADPDRAEESNSISSPVPAARSPSDTCVSAEPEGELSSYFS